MILTQNNKFQIQAAAPTIQKTIDDYRRDIKLLKVKYIQLQEVNQQYKQKLEWYSTKLSVLDRQSNNNLSILDASLLYQTQNQSQNLTRVGSSNNFMGADQQIMEQFSNRCKMYLGMSPESLFRAADIKYEGVLKDVIFKQFLLNSKLNMKPQHIQRIIQLCDLECTGKISRQGYNDCLQAFQINQESILEQILGENQQENRTYNQRSFYKFCENLISQLISPYMCYRHIDNNNEGYIQYEQFYGFTTKFMKNINDTEIIGIYTYLDIEKSQQISKDYFIVQTKKVMRIVSNDKNINISNFIDLKPSNDKGPVNGKGNSQNGKQNEQNENINNSNHGNCDRSKGKDQFHPNKIDLNLTQEVDLKQLIGKFVNSYKINIPNFVRIIADSMTDLRAGILLQDIFNSFKKIKNYKKVSNGDKLLFFKGLDTGKNGSIDYEELIKFYCKFKQPDWPVEIIFYLFARILLVIEIDAEQYFKYQGFTSQQVLKKQEFIKFAKSIFWVEEQAVAVELFQFLDKEQRNDIYLSALIDQVDFEIAEQKRLFYGIDNELNSTTKSISSTKKANVKDITELESFKEMEQNQKLIHIKKTALSDANVSLQQMQNIVNSLKPTLTENDFFLKHEIDENKQVIKTKWETILNDEISCLKKCIEIVSEMKDKGEQVWTDSEFGPNEQQDPYGSKSMYFSSNEIPPGCPEPENVRWLRLNEIVDEYIENHGDEYLSEDEIKELQHIHFLYEGASSNDVKQSKYLGDCWFISALSIVSEYNEYIDGEFDPHKPGQTEDQKMFMMSRGIYPPLFHFLSQYGIYVMKFFKNYKWRYVIIDNRLPCLENGEIIFSQCATKNEFWVSLIEKAYAKIHSNYQALNSGDMGQGLQDLTGNLSIKMKLDNFKYSKDDIEFGRCPTTIDVGEKINTQTTDFEEVWEKLQSSKEAFWQTLMAFKEKGCLIGCSADGGTEALVNLDGEKTGIYSGHAYSINYLMQLDYINQEEKENHKRENPHQNHRILIVRNPWGYGEWQLKWSENPDYIDKVQQYMPKINKFFDDQETRCKKLGITTPERYEMAEDGKFLICYKDWRRIFNNLFVCLLFSDAWSGFRIKGCWNQQFSSGVLKKSEQSFKDFALKNPQFIIELKNKSGSTEKSVPFFINLAQNDGRLFNGEKYPYQKIQQSMMLCLFELKNNQNKLDKYSEENILQNSGKYSQRREVQLDSRCLLEYGKKYCLIPSIKNQITNPEDEQHFYLNIFGRCKKEDFIITKVNQDFQIKELGVNAVSQIEYEKTCEFKNVLIQAVNKQLKEIKI
ncbi:hypothetical protein ABPG72_011624 [Tetrahymena utriculariae]